MAALPERLPHSDQFEASPSAWLLSTVRRSIKPQNDDYAGTAFVPPETADTGLVSLVARVRERSAWRSVASRGWLAVPNNGPQMVVAGCLSAVTEGRRVVGYFQVDYVKSRQQA